MGTTTSSIFNGNSRYSSDFQAVIDRATAIEGLRTFLGFAWHELATSAAG